jgi:hypothetical protein
MQSSDEQAPRLPRFIGGVADFAAATFVVAGFVAAGAVFVVDATDFAVAVVACFVSRARSSPS